MEKPRETRVWRRTGCRLVNPCRVSRPAGWGSIGRWISISRSGPGVRGCCLYSPQTLFLLLTLHPRFPMKKEHPDSLTPQRKHRKLLKDGSGSEVWPEAIEKTFVHGEQHPFSAMSTAPNSSLKASASIGLPPTRLTPSQGVAVVGETSSSSTISSDMASTAQRNRSQVTFRSSATCGKASQVRSPFLKFFASDRTQPSLLKSSTLLPAAMSRSIP